MTATFDHETAKHSIKSLLEKAIILSILSFAGITWAAPLNSEGEPPTKPVTVTGKLGYGCGPTNGTGCFLITAKGKQSYVIGGYFPDLPEGAAEALNRAKDGDKQVTVTGQLKRNKFNGYRAFDLSYTIDVK
jgi:hypothetical protein